MDMPSLFDRISDLDTVKEMYDKIEGNCAGRPRSSSKELWSLRCRTNIDPGNAGFEVLLERSVALLAQTGHMPGWYNQCPVASGIASSTSDRRSAVDLVHWSETTGTARFVELKWKSDGPHAAIHQVLQYGIAYILCRAYRKDLPLQNRCLMDAQHITLEVIAPFQYYDGDRSDSMEMGEYLSETSLALDEFARSKTEGALTMSLNALAFPEDFSQVPFENGQDVRDKCSTRKLTVEAQMVRDAFAGLTSVWFDS